MTLNSTFLSTTLAKMHVWFVICTILFYSCDDNSTAKELTYFDENTSNQDIIVDGYLARIRNFKKTIYANGILYAGKTTELSFRTGGYLEYVAVSDGKLIKKGDTIAALNADRQLLNLIEKEELLKKARIEFDYLLMGYSASIKDTSSINKKILDNLKIQSGLETALIQLRKAKMDYHDRFLTSPVSGHISIMSYNNLQHIKSGEVFCKVYDFSMLECRYKLMESEVFDIQCGDSVEIKCGVNNQLHWQGIVSNIKPEVEKSGMVEIIARIKHNNFPVFHGMSTETESLHCYGNKVLIPKNAVVIRNNKPHIFLYSNTFAIWKYVTILDENEHFYCIHGQIDESDTIIISHNEFLSHNTPVVLNKIIEQY